MRARRTCPAHAAGFAFDGTQALSGAGVWPSTGNEASAAWWRRTQTWRWRWSPPACAGTN